MSRSNHALDAILKSLNDAYNDSYENNVIIPDTSQLSRIEVIFSSIANGGDYKDLHLALLFLQRQGYIEYSSNGNDERYKISFTGRVFIESGGYTQQQNQKNEELRLKRIERILLTGGTVAAGIYGIFQICQWAFHGSHYLLSVQAVTFGTVCLIGFLVSLMIGLIMAELRAKK